MVSADNANLLLRHIIRTMQKEGKEKERVRKLLSQLFVERLTLGEVTIQISGIQGFGSIVIFFYSSGSGILK